MLSIDLIRSIERHLGKENKRAGYPAGRYLASQVLADRNLDLCQLLVRKQNGAERSAQSFRYHETNKPMISRRHLDFLDHRYACVLLAGCNVVFEFGALDAKAIDLDLAIHSAADSESPGRVEDCEITSSVRTMISWNPVWPSGSDERGFCLFDVVQIPVREVVTGNDEFAFRTTWHQSIDVRGICNPDSSTDRSAYV